MIGKETENLYLSMKERKKKKRFFFSRRRGNRSSYGDWGSEVCVSDLVFFFFLIPQKEPPARVAVGLAGVGPLSGFA